MSNTEYELRELMEVYCNRLDKLEEERQEAKQDDNFEDEITVEVLQRQCRIMISQLFTTMKNIGVLDEEEVEFGSVKIK